MKDFILKYWLEIVFGALISVLSAGYMRIKSKLKRQNDVETALIALLHDRIYQACKDCINQGRCNVEDKRNIEYLYKPYKQLGGNGTAETLYNQCQALPLKSANKMS